MNNPAVIAIFDIGKTNKKFLLLDQRYHILEESSVQIPEITDEDNFPCEDLAQLTRWVKDEVNKLLSRKDIDLKALNISAYGASFVLLDEKGEAIAPLYNYLKPYPESLQNSLFEDYGGARKFSLQTASPILGNLNSGLQLYRIAKTDPDLFEKIHCALHLPQYLAYLLTGSYYSDISSIGCHTMLWDFSRSRYHDWVYREGIDEKLAPVYPGDKTLRITLHGSDFLCGVGLHDSSAALIPYQSVFQDPFILLSTGTWSIALNPFQSSPLTSTELEQDCLCYLDFKGHPVKASRLFAGHEHEVQLKRIAAHFHLTEEFYREIPFRKEIITELFQIDINEKAKHNGELAVFRDRNLSGMRDGEMAYHRLIMDLVDQQVTKIRLILPGLKSEKIFVDGGFTQNEIFMKLLALSLPEREVYAASAPQASAIGAAMAVHHQWNDLPLSTDVIQLSNYSSTVSIK